MSPIEHDTIARLEQSARQSSPNVPPILKSAGRPTVHWTELPEAVPGERTATEWNFYRTQVGRLLGEGHEGRWVLVKGAEIVGIWDTQQEANAVRVQRYLMEDALIQQVHAREPLLRGPSFFRACPS